MGLVVGLLWACGGRIDRREDDGMVGRDGNEVGGAANTHAADGPSVGYLGADVSAQIEWGLQWELRGGLASRWGVFGNSVGSVGAAPVSFCVWVGKAAPALGCYCDALQWWSRYLPAWCWCVRVEWGVGK